MISLLKLGSADLKTARELFLSFQEDDGIVAPTTASDAYLRARLADPGFHVLVALDEDRVAGGLTAYELKKYKSETLEIMLYEIGVQPGYRRQGIGRRLIEMLIALARERGASGIFVETSCHNAAAMGLYACTGGRAEPDGVQFIYVL